MYINSEHINVYRHTVDGKTSCKTSWWNICHIIFQGFIHPRWCRIFFHQQYFHEFTDIIYIFIMLFASEDQSGSYGCFFFVKNLVAGSTDPEICFHSYSFTWEPIRNHVFFVCGGCVKKMQIFAHVFCCMALKTTEKFCCYRFKRETVDTLGRVSYSM